MSDILSPARRVVSFDDVQQAGDYSGPHPVDSATGQIQQVWFLLPVHEGNKYEHSHEGCGIHGVHSPPHRFRECKDGSLEIRDSIGCGPKPYYWHGYLDEGNVWRQLKPPVLRNCSQDRVPQSRKPAIRLRRKPPGERDRKLPAISSSPSRRVLQAADED